MKKVIFIGNRRHVLDELLQRKDRYLLHQVWVLDGSPLQKHVAHYNSPFLLFQENAHFRELIDDALMQGGYDLIISNGCPFILPVNKIRAAFPQVLMINIHPTALPELKGKTPLNGIFYNRHDHIGATAHYMNEKADGGNIIFREVVPITSDIDQGLVYFISFKLEGMVFSQALNILEQHDFNYAGEIQAGEGSVFNRTPELFVPDFEKDNNDEIIRKVKSVGILSQGTIIRLDDKIFHVFEADEIINPWLLSHFDKARPASLILEYSNKILVKTKDGIVRFSIQNK